MTVSVCACSDPADPAESDTQDDPVATDVGTNDGDTGHEDLAATETGDTVDVRDAVDSVDMPAPVCSPSVAELPPGVVELSPSDAAGAFSVNDVSWTVAEAEIAVEPLWEAIQFDLDGPGEVLGFSIQWTDDAPDADRQALVAGLYPDFGYNGFDFWQYEPYWEDEPCSGPNKFNTWADYMLEAPIEWSQPGLIFVAHWRAEANSPVWLLDDTFEGEGDCASFGSCHSALNLPHVQADQFFNGSSTPIPYDFKVRLYWLPGEPESDDLVFEAVPDVAPNNRSAWGDYDNDGFDDLLSAGVLLHNQGDGTFVDATESSGITAMSLAAGGGVWGDFDNDGCLDLLTFAESLQHSEALLRNLCDGTFENVTETSGISDLQDYNDCGDPANVNTPTPAAAWWDIDSDGLLDIYLANMMCWEDYSYYVDTAWRNNGDGSFTQWAFDHGFSTRGFASRGANPIDYDQDGDVDLLVNNYVLHPNLFYENRGNGVVRDEGEELGLAGTRNTHGGREYYGHTIGTAWGDLDGDGDFDVIEANLAHPRFFTFSDKTMVLLQRRRGGFADTQGDWSYPAGEAGLRYIETHSVPVLADFDHDGALDLVISSVYDGRPTDFYWGNGDATFELDVLHSGITVTNGWGMASSDFDNDGDVDLAARGELYENVWPLADDAHWLQARLIGNVSSNWAALGATCRVFLDSDAFLVRHVSGGSGQGCQSSLTLHFGLGADDTVDHIEVDFPGGETIIYDGPIDVDQRLWLYEDGTMEAGWALPE